MSETMTREEFVDALIGLVSLKRCVSSGGTMRARLQANSRATGYQTAIIAAYDAQAERIVELTERSAAQKEHLDHTLERIAELEAVLSGDPSQTASKVERDAWRLSAVRYADKCEARTAVLESVAIKFLHAHVPSGVEPYFIVDPQDVYDFDVALGRPGHKRIFKEAPDDDPD